MSVRYSFLIIALLFPFISVAQLSAPGNSAVRYTSYPSAPTIKDPVFIFCNNSGSQPGALTANSPGGTGPFNYSWYKWNDITKSFSDFIKTESAVTQSSLTSLTEGGYKVNISGGFNASLIGWIFIDKPFSLAQLQNRTCDYVALKGQAAIDTFYYKDPANGSKIKLPDAVKFLWSSDPPSSIPSPDFGLNPQTFNPPLVNVTYKLHVSDSFGCISESSFFYESIHVKAEFSVDPAKGEAPLEVAFTDKSIRGTYKYTWDFGDKTPDGKKTPPWIVKEDSLWIFTNPFIHRYFKPGSYSPKLTIESKLGCMDSFPILPSKIVIVVDPSDLNIPNVFTPDGDGLNDNFIVESKSLRFLNVEIFSRSGMKVYSFSGDGEKLRTWQGWDGNVNKSSIKASPGIYFYVIRAIGWDDVEYDSKEQRGFVYLYR